MKILQIIDCLNVGGAERVFIDLCNILHENNEDVTALLLLPKKGELSDELHIPIIELNRKDKWNIHTMYKCGQILKEFDVIHCHLRHVYKYIGLVNFLMGSHKKIIFQDHYGAIDVDTSVPFLFNSLLKPIYYIGVSETLTNWGIKKLKLEKQNVFLLQNIIRKLDLPKTKNKTSDLLLVSNIKPIKNNAFAIELAKALKLSLLLVGRNQNEIYYNQVIKDIDDEHIKIDRTISKAQSIMGNATLGLHTSKSETGPLVLIEYLAQGLPFVAYKTGEVAEMLEPDFPDFFVDNFEIDCWKEKIKHILEKGHDHLKMEKIFEEYFGEKQYFTKIKNIYLCVIKE